MNGSPQSTGRLCVVGVGAATAVGETAPVTAAAIRAGVAMFTDHPHMIDKEGEPFVVAKAPFLADDLSYENRFSQLALPAIREALQPLCELPQADYRVPAFVGLPSDRPGLPIGLTENISECISELTLNGIRIHEIQFLPHGHAAGLMAVESSHTRISQDGVAFCLAGGIDSYFDPDTLAWIEDSEQLHKLLNAWGFVPGEAAGFCLLCSDVVAEELKLNVLGYITAIATAHEENRIKTETVCAGKGLTQALNQLLPDQPTDKPLIDETICDQNGEAYRADEYGFTLARTNQWFRDSADFLAPADCWGDVGAASGPLFIMLAAFAAGKGYGKGSTTLVWTSSEGGERCAALFESVKEEAS